MNRALCSVTTVFIGLFLCQSVSQAYSDNLGYMASGKKKIKVFINNITEEPDRARIEAADFKTEVEKAFTNRRSVSFEVVKSPAESDVIVSAVITHYQYLHRGPLKPSISLGTMLADAAATATMNYVDMAVDFSINDSRTGRVLWNRTITAYAKRDMTADQSIPLIYDKVARAFVAKSFGKGR